MTRFICLYHSTYHLIFLTLISTILSSNLYAQNISMYVMDKNNEFTKSIKLNDLNKKKEIKVFSFYDKKCLACFEDFRVISIAIKRKQPNVEFYGFQMDLETDKKSESIVDRERRFKDFLSAISKYGLITKYLLPKPILVSTHPQSKTRLLDLFSQEFKIDLQPLTTKSYPFHVICDENKSCMIFNEGNDLTISNDYDIMNDFFKSTTSFNSSETKNEPEDYGKTNQPANNIFNKLKYIFYILIGLIFLRFVFNSSKSKNKKK